MNGIVNFYFPCKLKKTFALRSLERKWKIVRNRHNREMDLMNQPLTDLNYRGDYRTDIENVLSEYQRTLGGRENSESSPFATVCLKNIYRGMHNDYIFSKNVSVVVSTFCLGYEEHIKGRTFTRELQGILLLNVNAENRVATFIMCISFNNFTIDQCIYLKHVVFKNCKVTIKETIDCQGFLFKKNSCQDCVLGKEFFVKGEELEEHTIREYIKKKSFFCNKVLDDKLDFRCRYTYLEIDKLPQQESSQDIEKEKGKNIYGLITSDEYYNDFDNNLRDKDKNKKYIDTLMKYKHQVSFYQIHVNGYHALQINADELRRNYFEYKNESGYIDTNDFERVKSCIAGVSHNEVFPKYLKAVEIHYLINNETTNEISPKDRSYINPIIFIKRAVRLWKVIYEVDTNKYHNSGDFMESFGINKLLKELRDEYNSLLVYIVGFFTITLTLLTLVSFILSVLK